MITKLDEKRSSRTPTRFRGRSSHCCSRNYRTTCVEWALQDQLRSRKQEVVKLRWDWEIPVPELDTSVFLIPSDLGGKDQVPGVKNGEERLVVLNTVAKPVIEGAAWPRSYLGIPIRDARQEQQGDTGSPDERFRLEEGPDQGGEEVPGTLPTTGAGGVCLDPCSQPEAHLWKKAQGRRNRVRQAGPAGPQERQHYHSLLCGGAGETDR
jgi:hypothetical protein